MSCVKNFGRPANRRWRQWALFSAIFSVLFDVAVVLADAASTNSLRQLERP